MAAKIKTLNDPKTGEQIAPRTFVEAIKTQSDGERLPEILANKASKADVELVNQRVSNLVQNPGEATEGNAELVDIRVGHDGTQYETAGDAVRGQVQQCIDGSNKLKSDLYKVQKNAGTIYPNVKINEGYYINSSLQKISSDVFSYSNPIQLLKGWTVTLTATASSTAGVVSMITLAESDGTLVSAEAFNLTSKATYSYTADSDCYIVLSFRNDYDYDFELEAEYTNEKLNSKISNIESVMNDYNITENETYTVNSGYISNTGKVLPHSDLIYTSPIYVNAGCTIKYGLQGVRNVVALISRYENGVYVPVLNSQNSEFTEGIYTVKENGYYVLCTDKYANYYSKFYFDVKNTINTVNELLLSTNTNYITMFHKIGVIGDSLSSGEIVKNNVFTDRYGYSWLSHIARRNGVEYECYSQGGMSAKSWLENQGGKYNQFVNDQIPPSAVYIALGSNDSRESYPVGSSADDEGPNSFCGYIKRIISTVRTKNENIPIFLVTPYSKSETYVPYAEAIKNIADVTDNCFFIDYLNNSEGITIDANYPITNGGHFTTIGYVKCSEIIEKLTNIAVRKNLNDFVFNALYFD